MSKLHYFAVNKHTKYKPIRCELNDDDKYPVKNPQWLLHTRLTPCFAFMTSHARAGTCRPAVWCWDFPIFRDHAQHVIVTAPIRTRASVVVISASELDGFHDMSLFLLGETRIW